MTDDVRLHEVSSDSDSSTGKGRGALVLFDRHDFGVFSSGANGVADRFSDQSPRQRRDVRDGPFGGIRLILADKPEGLLAPVIPYDGDGIPELNGTGARCGGNDLGAGAACAPIPQVSSGARQRRTVTRSLRFAIGAARGVERQINQRQSLFGHVIGVPGDGPIRHIVNESVLIYECSAHPPNIGVRRLVFIRFAARSFERCGRHPLRWVAVGLQPPVRPKRISTLQARC
jgi:hypothetical protein